MLDFIEFLNSTDKISFRLTGDQWKKLNEFGENSLITLTNRFSEDLASTSKRLGIILMRICMVLTALKYFDRAELSNEFICADEDFEIALKLVKVYEQHSISMFKKLPKSTTRVDKTLKKLYDLLPESFQRKEAIQIANDKLMIKKRSADDYLSKYLVLKMLDSPKSGYYTKIK